MSKSNRTFVLLYILLVGVPIGGVLGVLEKGRSLKAPISIDGDWKIETEGHVTVPCATAAAALEIPAALSQSGQTFTLSFDPGRPMLLGTLSGSELQASGPASAWPGENTCAGKGPLYIRATVDPKASQRTISGTLSFNACAGCTPVEFRAYRQPAPARRGH